MKDNKILYFNKLLLISIVVSGFLALIIGRPQSANAEFPQQSLQDPSTHETETEAEKTSVPPLAALPTEEQPDDLWERIRLDLSWQDMHSPQVDSARRQFLRQRNYLPDISTRADYYLYHIVEEVQKRDMPMEIALIPFVESSLNPFAAGPAGAAGLWQIMPATGSHLGLERNSAYDGRKDLHDSTEVALDYLESLHQEFDEDWLLALAAYNSGSGTVTRAREANDAKGLDTDFWSLNLPGHTRAYIPKVIALAQILADPELFDVYIPSVENAPAFEVVDIEKPLEITQAAKLAGVDIDTLRALNPGQLGKSVAPNQSGELLLPVGTGKRFEYNIAKLSPEELVQSGTYRIKAGDSLGAIASKYNTDVALLQEVNGIHGNDIHVGDTLTIPGDGNVNSRQQSAANGAERVPQVYLVRNGDTLSRIARKFSVSVSDIRAWNALKADDYIHPGQRLTVHAKGV